MISFPNAKINLGLNVVSKRTDGYHNIETVFYPVNVTDALEVIRSTAPGFTSTGINIDGNAQDNLCVKAYDLLKTDFPHLPAVQIHLHKNIPTGAGLGGGSADAAFMLTMLNRKFGLNIGEEKLAAYALKLGSDCPFFIYNKPCLATGRGEKLESLAVDLSAYTIILINPSIHISTKTAFSGLIPSQPERSLKEIITQPVSDWKNNLKNDFEDSVFNSYPEIKALKETLYAHGATFAAMSGSGSTVFGLFKQYSPQLISFPANYSVYII